MPTAIAVSSPGRHRRRLGSIRHRLSFIPSYSILAPSKATVTRDTSRRSALDARRAALPCRQPHRGRSASLVRSLLRVSRDKGSGWLPACVGESLPILVRSSASPQLNTPPGGTRRGRI